MALNTETLPQQQPPAALTESIAKEAPANLAVLLTNANKFLAREFAPQPTPQPTLEQRILADADFAGLLKNADRFQAVKPSKERKIPVVSRRNFLFGGLAAAAALFMAGRPDIAEPTTTPTVKPIVGPTIEPSPTPPGERINLINELLKPLIDETKRKRAEREKSDPEYHHRVDKELNQNRVNILMFSYGEKSDLASGQFVEVGTDQIVSINTKTNEIDLISITHDTRAPEAEQHLRSQGQDASPMKLDAPYKVGGFALMRKTFENATGLSVDFQLVFQETAVQHLIDDVFGGLSVDVPFTFSTDKISLSGTVYDQAHFNKGKVQLDGTRVVQFMKGGDTEGYIAERGPHQRKHLILSALKEAVKNNLINPTFLPRLLMFFTDEKKKGGITFDFDETKVMPNVVQLLTSFARSGELGQLAQGKSIFIMDAAIGDGGVQWVTANAQDNPKTKLEIEGGKYRDLAMEIPYDADPDAEDLVNDYWQSVRQLIKDKLIVHP